MNYLAQEKKRIMRILLDVYEFEADTLDDKGINELFYSLISESSLDLFDWVLSPADLDAIKFYNQYEFNAHINKLR